VYGVQTMPMGAPVMVDAVFEGRIKATVWLALELLASGSPWLLMFWCNFPNYLRP